MTGFGAAEGPVGDARVNVEVRSVNHRFFSPSLKLPPAFTRWEGEIREVLRKRIARGHVTVTVRIAADEAGGHVVDEQRFGDYVRELRDLASRHGLGQEIDLATVLRLPGVLNDGATEPAVEGPAELLAVVEAAVEELAAMRRAEGGRMTTSILERVALVEAALARITGRAPERLRDQQARLKQNVAELAGGVAVDPQRLAQEIALIADRLDVSEELDRFNSHVAAFRATLSDGSGEPVGKRLGFLMQEMLRETNTTGSKANDAVMLADVVAIKEELERIREQVENLE
jgi:uncharacterized protein (TIGR00255 family)